MVALSGGKSVRPRVVVGVAAVGLRVGNGRFVDLVVAVVVPRVRSILSFHEGRPARLVRT